MSDELSALREKVATLESRLVKIETQAASTMGTNAAMARLGYKDRHSFWAAVARMRIPYSRINKRLCVFRTSDIDAALARRQIGTSKPRRLAA